MTKQNPPSPNATNTFDSGERWLPLVFRDRAAEPVAAARSSGTDVDFGLLTRHLLGALAADVRYGQEVRALRRDGDRWRVDLADGSSVLARFVFVGAGGGTLPLLRSAGLAAGVGGFPISGRFLRTARPLVTAGQRVQVLRRTGGRGTIAGFGTETVVAADGSLAGLLGASPGASAAAATMIDVLAACFPDRMARWAPRLREFDDPQARTVLGLT